MLRDTWLVRHDRLGRVIEVGAWVRVAGENVVGIVRSIGTKAWLDVDGRRRGVAFDEVEMLPEGVAARSTGLAQPRARRARLSLRLRLRSGR